MTIISTNRILKAIFEEDDIKKEDISNISSAAEESICNAMRECSKVVLERVLKNLSTGIKYEKSDVEKVIKLTLKELE